MEESSNPRNRLYGDYGRVIFLWLLIKHKTASRNILRKITKIFLLIIRIFDIRQCHFPGDQNRAQDRYEEEAYNPNEEGQHVFKQLSQD